MADSDTVPIGTTEAAPINVSAELGVDDKIASVTGKMADNQRAKVAATDKVFGEVESVQNRMLPKLEKLVDKEIAGVESGDLKRWDEEQQKGKYHTDPVTAFGSLGSVFGAVAGAFTRNPMVNSLNASAAAMTAIKEHDDQGYQRAYKAWQDNAKLALDRQKIVHEAYSDASSLLSTNMEAANTKMKVLAARFGDQQVLTMLEAGMNKEVEDLFTARQKAANELALTMPKIAAANDEYGFLKANGYDSKFPNSPESQAAYQKLRDRQLKYAEQEQDIKAPEVQKLLKDYRITPKEDGSLRTVQERADFYDKHVGIAGRGASSIANKFLADWDVAHPVDPSASPEERAAADTAKFEALAKFMATQKGALTTDQRQQQIDIQRAKQEEDSRHKQVMEDLSYGKGDVAQQRADEVERHNKAVEKLKTENPGGTGHRTPKPEEAEINRRKDEKVAAGMDPGKAYEEAVQETRRASVVPSAKLADDLTSKIERVTYAQQTIDKVEDLLKKHKAITGLGGTVTRPGEVVGNWFGSNETDRAQFRRYISELQEWAPRVLNDSSGRPLSAEAAKVSNIIAGLSPGDTTANTARAYKELRELLGQMRVNLINRRDGSKGEKPAEKSKSSQDAPWLNDPVVGPKSEGESDATDFSAQRRAKRGIYADPFNTTVDNKDQSRADRGDPRSPVLPGPTSIFDPNVRELPVRQ